MRQMALLVSACYEHLVEPKPLGQAERPVERDEGALARAAEGLHAPELRKRGGQLGALPHRFEGGQGGLEPPRRLVELALEDVDVTEADAGECSRARVPRLLVERDRAFELHTAFGHAAGRGGELSGLHEERCFVCGIVGELGSSFEVALRLVGRPERCCALARPREHAPRPVADRRDVLRFGCSLDRRQVVGREHLGDLVELERAARGARPP